MPRVCDLFERQATRTPDRIAVTYLGKSLTYGELNAQANRLAHFLRRRDLGAESVIGLHLGRSLELMIAVLGTLKAGAAYLPLDPQYPRQGLDYMASDCGVAAIVTDETPEDDLDYARAQTIRFPALGAPTAWSSESAENPALDLSADTLAYVLYTSGSTGRPKGVEICHRSVVGFLESMRAILAFSSEETLLSVTGLTFDIAGLDLYLTWMTGARLWLVPRAAVFDGLLLKEALETARATCLQTTPVTWRMLLDTGWRAPREFKALCGGEAMPEPLWRDLLDRKVHLWNLYGPTETTIWSTAREMTSAEGHPLIDRVTIGAPIANTQVYVLDETGNAVAPGEIGELYIGGAGLARGYRNRPQLTAERFVISRSGERLYRTGDRARWAADGELEILGRVDHQIKWHGYRIEPGEIEAALREVARVKDCVALVKPIGGEPQIVGFVVGQLDPLRVRRELAARLPAYMVPAAIVPLEKFPLTPNGKLDRAALPAPEAEHV